MRSLYVLVLLVSLSLVVDVDAGWKFWKKKKDDNSTTEDPLSTSSQPGVSPGPTTKLPTTQGPTTKAPLSINSGLSGAANPGLSIGVGNTGGNIRDNARPGRPNPGTDVGLDLPRQKPSNSGYRDWAIDLTGAAEGRAPPKVPSTGPALSPGQQTRPGSPTPASPLGQQSPTGVQTPRPRVQIPSSGVQTPRPQSPVSTPQPVTSKPGAPDQQRPSSGLGYPSQPSRPATPKPGAPDQQRPSSGLGYPSQPSRPATPTSSGGSKDFPSLSGSSFGSGDTGKPSTGNQSPTNGKSFAQAAAGGSTTPRSNFGGPVSSGGKSGIGAAGVAAGAAGIAAAGASGQKFSSNPMFSKGNTVTDEDLQKLSEALFIKDVNNAMKHITLNLQKQTSGSSPVDEAPQPLLNVKQEAFQIPTIQKVLTIYDNYNLDTRTNEHINPAQRQEESLLVDTFLSTNVMSYAMRFLANKGFIKQDYYDYKDLLRTMWFNLFSRGDGKIGSTGFEHVFMTELKLGTEVSGLHNWIYFNAEELKKRADYLGYIKKVDLGDKAAILKVHAKFNGLDKPVTTMFIGTSPELEMSLYTVCFVVRPEQPCPVSLGGTKFNIITHKFRYRGKDHVGSAYPDI